MKRWLYLVAFVMLTASISETQITFSKDWNAGKRALSRTNCLFPVPPKFKMCQTVLVKEIHCNGMGSSNLQSADYIWFHNWTDFLKIYAMNVYHEFRVVLSCVPKDLSNHFQKEDIDRSAFEFSPTGKFNQTSHMLPEKDTNLYREQA